MPTTLQELPERIAAAVTDIHGNILENVWTKLDYSLELCRVIKRAHTLRICRMCQELAECIFSGISPASLYIVYLSINSALKPDESFRLTLYIAKYLKIHSLLSRTECPFAGKKHLQIIKNIMLLY